MAYTQARLAYARLLHFHATLLEATRTREKLTHVKRTRYGRARPLKLTRGRG